MNEKVEMKTKKQAIFKKGNQEGEFALLNRPESNSRYGNRDNVKDRKHSCICRRGKGPSSTTNGPMVVEKRCFSRIGKIQNKRVLIIKYLAKI